MSATTLAAAPSDNGAISLKSVLNDEASSESSEASRRAESRRLMTELRQSRSGRPLPAAKASTAEVQSKEESKEFVRPRGILLTSGQDDAATVTIPNLLPPPVPGLTNVTAGSMASGRVSNTANLCQCQKCVSKRTGRRVARTGGVGQKLKAGARRVLSCFVEVEECDEVHFDVDDYNMPILLVAASDETPDEALDEDPAVRLLSRKLTDIQPTLAYAYGEDDKRLLPDAFYKKVDHGIYKQQIGPKMVLQWEPTNLWYYPLYFEDVGLERYGHTHKPWVQPFVSTGKFFGQVVGLPYKMTLDSPHCPQYALGYYQPGEWAPKKKYQVPWNEEAAATQFLWMTGFFLLVP